MSWIERLQSVLVALAALAGLAAGLATPAGKYGEYVVIPALLVMLAAIFVQMEPAHLGEARGAPSVVFTSLVLNFLFTPALAWALGAGLLGDQPDLRIGLMLLLVTPCTDWYLVFTAIAKGHTGIAAALLPINLVLQLLLLPIYVLLLGGEAAMVDVGTLVQAVFLMLLVPLTVALFIRRLTRRARGAHWQPQRLNRWAGRLVAPLLCLAVFAMFAWQAPIVASQGAELALLLPALAGFFIILPLVATLASKFLVLPGPQRVTLTMVVTARNSPIALGIAVAAFPDRPLIAVALVIGPLVELPVLALLAQIIRHRIPLHGSGERGTSTVRR